MNRNTWIVGAIATLATSTVSAAQPTGPYIGLLGGSTRIELRDPELDTEGSRKKVTFGAFAGWQITPYVSLEAAYYKVGKISETLFEDDQSARISLDFRTLSASLIGTLPLGDRWSFFGRAGGARLDATLGYVDDDFAAQAKDHTTKFLWGTGVGVIVEGARIRLEYSRTSFSDGNAGLTALGIAWFLPYGR